MEQKQNKVDTRKGAKHKKKHLLCFKSDSKAFSKAGTFKHAWLKKPYTPSHNNLANCGSCGLLWFNKIIGVRNMMPFHRSACTRHCTTCEGWSTALLKCWNKPLISRSGVQRCKANILGRMSTIVKLPAPVVRLLSLGTINAMLQYG